MPVPKRHLWMAVQGGVLCIVGLVFVCSASAQTSKEKSAQTGKEKSAQSSKDKKDDKEKNYGREARESTPILNRDPDKPLSDWERIHHALCRFTYGPTPELIKELEAMGLEKWFKAQLDDKTSEGSVVEARLAELASLNMTNQEVVQAYNPPLPSLSRRLTPEELRKRAEMSRLRNVPRDELKDAVLLRNIYSNRQVLEVAADFWRSHFNVDTNKGNVQYYATEYDREVIRGEALGTFWNMLAKQARHPAMLVYLDNFVSRGTPQGELLRTGQEAFAQSRDYATAMQAIDIARMRGLNENYARELMELHTLGVDNYYTQEDVIAVAEALTGWTVQQNADQPIVYEFRRDMHQTGPRRVLGRIIPANPANPEIEGQAVLQLLGTHVGTADFIAYKLCRYFVDDNPPPEMVERVANVFKRKKTDLKATYLAILTDEEFYNPRYYQAKFKRPMEFVASALRITQAEVLSTDPVHRTLTLMSEPIYQCEDPTGYYDQADAWRDPGVMANRWQFGVGLAMGWIRGVRISSAFWEGLEPNNPLQWKEELTKRILPAGCSEQTSEALDKVIAKYAVYNPQPEQLGRYIVGILLGSPEFQRQ